MGDVARFKEMGATLMKMLVSQSTFGGREVIISGQKGMGKTTIALKLAERLIGKEYVIWRGREIDVYTRLPNWQERTNILVPKVVKKVQFFERKMGRPKDVPLEVEYTTYSNAKDLFKKLDKDKLNVVYEPKFFEPNKEFIEDVLSKTTVEIENSLTKPLKGAFFWFDLSHRIMEEKGGEWASIFIDEAHQVFPQAPIGVHYHLNEYFIWAIDDFRNNQVSFYLTTHMETQIYYKVQQKIPFRIYLGGAQVNTKYVKFINPGVVARLPKGRGIIALIPGSKFGGFGYTPYSNDESSIVIKMKQELPTWKKSKKDIYSSKMRKILEEEGPYAAMIYLRQLHKEGKISTQYMNTLRKEIGPL